MSTDLKGKAINTLLIDEGFVPRTIIKDEDLKVSLLELMIEWAEGRYQDMRIVPGEHAMYGPTWKIKSGYHIVYVKEDEKHQNYDPEASYVVMLPCVHVDHSEENHCITPQDFYRHNKEA